MSESEVDYKNETPVGLASEGITPEDKGRAPEGRAQECQLPIGVSPGSRAQASIAAVGASTGSAVEADPQCLVCGDDSTGRHYGAHTCEGCKGFFRRVICYSLQNKLKCMAPVVPNQCLITNDRSRRKCCKSCRFETCIRVGMRPDLVVKMDSLADHNRDSSDSNASIGSKDLFRRELFESFDRNMLFDDEWYKWFDSTGRSADKHFFLVLNQLRLLFESKVRRFVSNITAFRRLEVDIQRQLISNSVSELLVLHFIFQFNRFQYYILKNNQYFGNASMDMTFRSVQTLVSDLTALFGDRNGSTETAVRFGPALMVLCIADSHGCDAKVRTSVQSIRDLIIDCFDLSVEFRAIKVSQILYFLRQMHCLFENSDIF